METSIQMGNPPTIEEKTQKTHILKSIFLSPQERRLRAGWRIFILGVIYQVFTFLLYLPLFFLFGRLVPPSIILEKSISLTAILLAVFLARRFLDRRSFISLGLELKWLSVKDLLAGFTIAGIIMALIYFLELSAGWLQFTGFLWQTIPSQYLINNIMTSLLLFSIVAFDEEIFSRGYHLQNFADGAMTKIQLPESKSNFYERIQSAFIASLNIFTGKKSLLWGSLASSLIFAFLHMANPNATLYAFIGLLAAGLFLSYAYLRTCRLWLPIGLHIGWNFFEGTIFGFPVSGIDLQGLVRQFNTGPAIITGGGFGPEAGLILFPGLALGSILVYIYTK